MNGIVFVHGVYTRWIRATSERFVDDHRLPYLYCLAGLTCLPPCAFVDQAVLAGALRLLFRSAEHAEVRIEAFHTDVLKDLHRSKTQRKSPVSHKVLGGLPWQFLSGPSFAMRLRLCLFLRACAALCEVPTPRVVDYPWRATGPSPPCIPLAQHGVLLKLDVTIIILNPVT